MSDLKRINSHLNKECQTDMLEREHKALVVMSGGQDSTTCLGVAIARHYDVHAVGFDYGQKHKVELEQAAKICEKSNVPFQIVQIPALQLMRSSALVTGGDVSQRHEYLTGLPASFVPVRNALFLTIAFGLAMELKVDHLYTGVCQTDYSGYPDCREEFIQQLEKALNIGYQSNIDIRAPLMHMDKAATFELARRVGALEAVIELSHTCYNGDEKMNEWGRGCGDCSACALRKAGYEQYLKRYVQGPRA